LSHYIDKYLVIIMDLKPNSGVDQKRGSGHSSGGSVRLTYIFFK
jgi:hypothetical protein